MWVVYSLGVHDGVEHEKNRILNIIDTTQSIGDEYLQDGCIDSTFKDIAKKKYEKEIGG
jgi:hypothetical protein